MKNKILKVPLKNQSYKIIIGNNIIRNVGTLIKKVIKKPKVFIVTNKVLKKYHLPKLLNSDLVDFFNLLRRKVSLKSDTRSYPCKNIKFEKCNTGMNNIAKITENKIV